MASKATVSPIPIELIAKIANNVIVNVKTKEEVQFKSLWADNTIVIKFMRRFGCVFCRYSAQSISLIQPQLAKRNIALVGLGFEWIGAEEFLDREYFDGELYIDSESRKCYNDLGFERVRSPPNKLTSIKKFLSASHLMVTGSVTGNRRGDDHQYGGTMIVSQGGKEILLLRKELSAMDSIKNETILRTLGIIEQELFVYDSLKEFGLLDMTHSNIKDKVMEHNIQATQQAADNVITNPLIDDDEDSLD